MKRVYVPLKIIPKGSHITDKSTFRDGFNLTKKNFKNLPLAFFVSQ